MTRVKILFLAANPVNTVKLRLDEEARDIQERIGRGQMARLAAAPDAQVALLEFATEWAVRVDDLTYLLLKHKPHVVHFSGHGISAAASAGAAADGAREMGPMPQLSQLSQVSVQGPSSELVLEDGTGRAAPVPGAALAELFGMLDPRPRCVLLNACHSKGLAEWIVRSVDCVIGMSRPISDPAAVLFATGFYEALAMGENVGSAFQFGQNALRLHRLSDQDVPQLLLRTGVDAAQVKLTETRGESDADHRLIAELLQRQEVREQLALYSSQIKTAREQLSLLKCYKSLHDAFQELEKPYNVLSDNLNYFATSAEAWDGMREQLIMTGSRITQVMGILRDPRIADDFRMCRQDLPRAAQVLKIADEQDDANQLKVALRFLQRMLGRDPSEANISLKTVVKTRPLKPVVEALQRVYAFVSAKAPDEHRLGDLRRLVADLEQQQQQLDSLTTEHDQWQTVDTALRKHGPDLLKGLDLKGLDLDLLEWWSEVQCWAGGLLEAGGAQKWAVELKQLGDKMAGALGQPEAERNARQVRKVYRDYVRAAALRFMAVDKTLLRTCDELEVVGQKLDLILNVLKVTS